MSLIGHHEREMIAFRRRNSASCIGALRDQGLLSFSGLARLTGLSRPTVESIVADLINHDLVTEHTVAGQPESTAATSQNATRAGSKAGRPARQFVFNAAAAYVASIDLGLHRVTVLLSDLAGVVVGSLIRELPAEIDAATLTAMMSAVFADTIAPLGIIPAQLAMVTVCVTGIVDDHGVLLQSNVLPEWNGVNLAAQFAEVLGCPVTIENDVNMAAVGEVHAGAARNADDVVFIMVGHRISAAIMLNGALHRGRNFAAGEVGDLESTGWGYHDVHETSVLGAFLGRSPEDVFAAAEAGDPDANELLAKFAHRIIRGIAVVGLTVDPDLIVIGGGLSSAGDVLLTQLRVQFAQLVTRRVQPRMVSSSLGMNGVALGGIVRGLELVSERLYGSSEIAVPRLTIATVPRDLSTAPFGTQLAGFATR